jgi:hypothetical protein
MKHDNLQNLRPLEPAGQSCDGKAGSCRMCSGKELDVSAGSSHMRPAQPCSCGCGRKEGGVACEAVICDGKRALVYATDIEVIAALWRKNAPNSGMDLS